MKCAEGLKKYFNKLNKDFHLYLVEVLEQYRETTVNDLRANLDQQMAFFRLLAALDPGFSPSLALEAYGKIYPKSGKVLDLQLATALVAASVAEVEEEKALAARLAKRAGKAREKFRQYAATHSLLPAKRLSSLIRSRLDFLPGEGLQERFSTYITRLFQSVRKTALMEETEGENFHNLQEQLTELYFNLLLILSLCSRPTEFAGRQIARLEDLRGLLPGWREVSQTLALAASGRKPWPAAVIQRLQREQVVRTARVHTLLEYLDEDLSTLEEHLQLLLANEPIEGGKPAKNTESKGKKGVHSSFDQINVDEGIK